MILVQDMLNKDKKFREFSEYRKSIALPQNSAASGPSMRNHQIVSVSKSH